MRALLLFWAVGATALAAIGWTREPPPVRSGASRPTDRSEGRERALREQIGKLESALAAMVPNDETQQPARGDAAALMAELRALQEGHWNQAAAGRIERDILRLVMSDAQAHRDLLDLLETSPEQANEVQGYLLSDLAGLVRDSAVTAEIRERARWLVAEGATADQRDAAARILMGYSQPLKDDVLLALERLNRETDADVRSTLLEVIADRGRGVGLTESEALPALQGFRDGIRSGRLWQATALARWSGSEPDYDLVQSVFRSAADDDARLSLLNAWQPDTRLAGARPERAKAFLLEVVTDQTHSEAVREMALEFLKDYAPWDRETAEAVRRALER